MSITTATTEAVVYEHVNGEKERVATWKWEESDQLEFTGGKVDIAPAYATQKLWDTNRHFFVEDGKVSHPVHFEGVCTFSFAQEGGCIYVPKHGTYRLAESRGSSTLTWQKDNSEEELVWPKDHSEGFETFLQKPVASFHYEIATRLLVFVDGNASA